MRFAKLGSWGQLKLLRSVVGEVLSIQPAARGEWIIGCVSEKQQSKLLQQSSLPGAAHQPIPIEARLPRAIVVGVVKGVPMQDKAEQHLQEDLEAQGYTVDSIRRLCNREGQQTSSVRVSLVTQVLPDKIRLGATLHRVVPFVPPIKRCTHCQQLGHSKQECRRKQPRCGKCGKGHTTSDCKETHHFCVNCHQPHPAYDRQCPEIAVRRTAHEQKNTNYVPFVQALANVRARSLIPPPSPGLSQPLPLLLPSPSNQPATTASVSVQHQSTEGQGAKTLSAKVGLAEETTNAKDGKAPKTPTSSDPTRNAGPSASTTGQLPLISNTPRSQATIQNPNNLNNILSQVRSLLEVVRQELSKSSPLAASLIDGLYTMLISILSTLTVHHGV